MSIKNNYLGDYTLEMDKLELAKGLRDRLQDIIADYDDELGNTRYMEEVKKIYQELNIQIRKEEPEVV